jgi:hypothetical protein
VKVISAAWHVIRGVLLGLAAIVIFIEEWGWRPLSAFVARFGRWPPLARLEARIAAAPRRIAMLLFLAPAVMLFPLKLAALWLIQEGHASLGISLIVTAKLIGTAIVGRLFVLLEQQLLSFAWFAWALDWWHRTRARVQGAVRASTLWQTMRVLSRGWRAWWHRATR